MSKVTKVMSSNGKGEFCLIDKEDLPLLRPFKYFVLCSHGKYMTAEKERVKGAARGERYSIHRIVMGSPRHNGRDIDHINGNGLDNRKINLRFCSRSQNIAAGKNLLRGKNTYRGVYLGKMSNKKPWAARIGNERKKDTYRWIGMFATEKEAALARDLVALEVYGEFATLNFEEMRPLLLKKLTK